MAAFKASTKAAPKQKFAKPKSVENFKSLNEDPFLTLKHKGLTNVFVFTIIITRKIFWYPIFMNDYILYYPT